MWTWNEAPIKFASSIVSASIVFVGGTYKGVSYVEERYAHQDDMILIEMRLNEKIESDRWNQVQARIWKLEDRYGLDHSKWPDYAKDELRNLQQTQKQLERHLQVLDEKLMQQGTMPFSEK